MKKYNVLIVEDHDFTRQTLSYELKKQKNINLINAFDNGLKAVEFIEKQAVDVILMDIDMPVMNGIEATKEIKKFNSGINVIILTNYNEKEKVFDAFSSGANAYCVKKIEINELLRVIEIVADSGVWFDKQIAKYIFEVLQNLKPLSKNELNNKTTNDFNITPRERNILKLMADGLSNEEISKKLVISIYTVKNHVSSIINKLSVKDRAQAAIFALKNKLFENSSKEP